MRARQIYISLKQEQTSLKITIKFHENTDAFCFILNAIKAGSGLAPAASCRLDAAEAAL